MTSLALAIPSGNEGKSKRSFEFRMCKKVAELTQVVHMLFTRNHEKEMEMEALKEAYEWEISEVIADANARIAKIQKEQENVLKQQTCNVDRIRKLLESEFQSREQDLQKKQNESEKHLQEERAESQNLRVLLIRAQKDIESLQQGVSDQKTSLGGEVAMREREMKHLKKQVQDLKQALESRNQDSSDAIMELQKVKDSLERELRHLHELLEESQITRDQLLARNKQLEIDLKALKRDSNRKMAEIMSIQKASRSGSAPLANQNEELERLRREVQRYRLELSNRDTNFNRMFSEKQPIHLDRSSASTGGGGARGHKLHFDSHSAGTAHPGLNGSMVGNAAGLLKMETVTGPVICFQEPEAPSHLPSEKQRARSTPSAHWDARDSCLPSISAFRHLEQRPQDAKARLLQETQTRQSSNGRQSKPRFLTKEMLFDK